MKAAAWIDRVKTHNGWESDYRAAKELGITQAAVSRIRVTEDATLSEETAEKIAGFLKMNPAGIILDQVAERSKNPETRATLSKMAGELCILCQVTIAMIMGAPRAASMRHLA